MSKEELIEQVLNIINEGWEGKRIDSHGRAWRADCVDIGTIGRDIDSLCRRIKRDQEMKKEAAGLGPRRRSMATVDEILEEQRRVCERRKNRGDNKEGEL